MAKLDPAQWRDMLGYLQRRHGPICRHWFEQLRPVTLESGLLKVKADNKIQENYLQKKCADQFTEAAQATTGALVAVRFSSVESEGGVVEPEERVEEEVDSMGKGDVAKPLGNGDKGSGGAGESVKRDLAARQSQVSPGEAQVMRIGQPKRRPVSVAVDDDEGEFILSPDYSFESFVTGPNNRLAAAAAMAVANEPGVAYNPLFIHGGVGLGKTHLLQAIAQKILEDNPQTLIYYLSCDAFMNRFFEAVQSGEMNAFRNRYRHVDVLIIDDIHFLAKREQSQEEFFHTFNVLYHNNHQLILSSDSPPAEIPDLEERLVSRFQWGLVAQVSAPEYETRVGIVRAKARLRGIELPEDVVSFIAAKIDSNARELEGAITTVQGHASLQDRVIELGLAKEALGEPAGGNRNSEVTLQHIIDVVTRFYNVKLSDLQSKRRHKSITLPRQVSMWMARQRTRFSLQEIGGYFGGRDHTTVMHSIRTVDQRMEEDEEFARQMAQINQQIGPRG